jgi:hypothetical protein
VNDLVSSADAAALLADLGNGRLAEELGPLFDAPMLVVDLDRWSPGDDAQQISLSRQIPCLLVGVRAQACSRPPSGLDLVVTTTPEAPRPWVSVPDRAAAIENLRRVVAVHPVAATTLIQVLRLGSALSIDQALVAESLAYSTLQGGSEHQAWLASRPLRPLPVGDRSIPQVSVGRDDDLLSIVLDRPDRHNAYGAQMRDELVAALRLASADPDISSVELRGRGPSFCSGGDLGEFGTRSDPASAHIIRTTRSAGAWLAANHDRSTAYLHGACIGAGIELPAFCRTVIAAPDTTIVLPEVGMGLIPGAGGTASIPRRSGRSRTAWLALTGARLDAGTAHSWGLVDRVE